MNSATHGIKNSNGSNNGTRRNLIIAPRVARKGSNYIVQTRKNHEKKIVNELMQGFRKILDKKYGVQLTSGDAKITIDSIIKSPIFNILQFGSTHAISAKDLEDLISGAIVGNVPQGNGNAPAYQLGCKDLENMLHDPSMTPDVFNELLDENKEILSLIRLLTPLVCSNHMHLFESVDPEVRELLNIDGLVGILHTNKKSYGGNRNVRRKMNRMKGGAGEKIRNILIIITFVLWVYALLLDNSLMAKRPGELLFALLKMFPFSHWIESLCNWYNGTVDDPIIPLMTATQSANFKETTTHESQRYSTLQDMIADQNRIQQRLYAEKDIHTLEFSNDAAVLVSRGDSSTTLVSYLKPYVKLNIEAESIKARLMAIASDIPKAEHALAAHVAQKPSLLGAVFSTYNHEEETRLKQSVKKLQNERSKLALKAEIIKQHAPQLHPPANAPINTPFLFDVSCQDDDYSNEPCQYTDPRAQLFFSDGVRQSLHNLTKPLLTAQLECRHNASSGASSASCTQALAGVQSVLEHENVQQYALPLTPPASDNSKLALTYNAKQQLQLSRVSEIHSRLSVLAEIQGDVIPADRIMDVFPIGPGKIASDALLSCVDLDTGEVDYHGIDRLVEVAVLNPTQYQSALSMKNKPLDSLSSLSNSVDARAMRVQSELKVKLVKSAVKSRVLGILSYQQSLKINSMKQYSNSVRVHEIAFARQNAAIDIAYHLAALNQKWIGEMVEGMPEPNQAALNAAAHILQLAQENGLSPVGKRRNHIAIEINRCVNVDGSFIKNAACPTVSTSEAAFLYRRRNMTLRENFNESLWTLAYGLIIAFSVEGIVVAGEFAFSLPKNICIWARRAGRFISCRTLKKDLKEKYEEEIRKYADILIEASEKRDQEAIEHATQQIAFFRRHIGQLNNESDDVRLTTVSTLQQRHQPIALPAPASASASSSAPALALAPAPASALQRQQPLALPAPAPANAAAEQRRVANAEQRAANAAAEQQRVANAERRAANAAAEQQRVANAERRAANAAAEQQRVANAAAAAERADQVIRNNIEDLSRVQNNLDFQTRINAMEPDRIREVIARLQQRMGNNNPNAAGRFQAGQLLGRIRQAVAQRAIGQGGSKKHKSHRTIRRRKNNKRRTHKRV